MKKIIINNKYTFLCDFKVRKGQTVVLPTPSWLRSVQGSTWLGKVTATKSDYTGYCEKAISIAA
jgi:hypothetical protein